MQEYKIEVQKREISNKKSDIKTLRHSGKIPGIYYSHDSQSSISYVIDQKILRGLHQHGIHKARFSLGSLIVNIIK